MKEESFNNLLLIWMLRHLDISRAKHDIYEYYEQLEENKLDSDDFVSIEEKSEEDFDLSKIYGFTTHTPYSFSSLTEPLRFFRLLFHHHKDLWLWTFYYNFLHY